MKKIKKQKRRKISILNILITLFIFSLLFLILFKNKQNIQKILTKTKRQKAPQEYTSNDLQIGDIVYYNHKIPQNDQDKTKQTVTIEPGTASTPGYGVNSSVSGNQTFRADKYNTTWRVWDKLSDGRVMLVSNKTVAPLKTGHGIGHIWWEHNAHKISSIFGYGYGADLSATNNFPYKVGSGIDNAPDMTEGDKGNWYIGKNGINVSGARSLTLPEVEKKLGITDESIKNKTTSSTISGTSPGYGNKTTTSMNSVVQRDIVSSNQTWEDKTKAKAKNKSYTMTDRYYKWYRTNIPETKYKEMLFNEINNWCGLATSALGVYIRGSNVLFDKGGVDSSHLGFADRSFVYSDGPSWNENEDSPSLRVAIYLESKIKYFKAQNEENAWDLQVPTIENKKVEIRNYQKLEFEPKINLVKDNKKTVCIKENNIFTANVEYKTGIERQGIGDEAIFVQPINKYIVEVENIPSGYTFEIEGIKNKEIDIKDKTSYTIIFKKNGVKLEDRDITIDDIQIGDIVYYNHKTPKNEQDKSKQTVTIEKGTASTPGYGGEDTRTAPQTFSAYKSYKYNTTWRVWDKLPDGRVMLVSNKTVVRFYTGHGVGHIWWEHNAHKISSIFGYGYGADTIATNNFPYKVGSGIDNAPDMTEGDKGNWKIGQNGINVSGARSLTLSDVEEKLEITEDKIKNGTDGIKNHQNLNMGGPYYGNQITTTMNSVVQRDIGSSNQTWEDKTKAKAKNKSYKMIDKHYWWEKTNMPESKYKEMLFNQIDTWCGLATNALDVYSGGSAVNFLRSYVDYNSSLGSDIFDFVGSDDSSWIEDGSSPTFRVAVYLQSKTKYLKAKNEENAWDLGDTLDTKQIKVNMKNSGSKDVKVKTKVKAVSNVDFGGINEYTSDSISNSQSSSTYEAKVKYGQKRIGSGDYARFTMYENKYDINIGIENLPLGHAYKVTGSKQGEIDVKDNLEYNVEIWDKYNLTLKDIIVRKDGKVDINNGISNLPNGSSITLKNKDEIIKTNEIGEKEYEVIVKIGEDVYNEKIKVKVIDNVQISVKYINEMLKNVITDIEPYITNEKVEIKLMLNNQYYDCKIVENGKYNIKFKVGENLENIPNGYRNEGEYTVEYFGKPTNDEYIVLKKDGKEVGKKYLYKAGKKELGDEVKYDIYLKPVLKLPFTGKYISAKIVVYTLGISLLLGIAVRHRRKILVMFKNYNVMK